MTRSPGSTGLAAVLLASSVACSGAPDGNVGATQGRPARAVIRITGSDTMVNLVQAWAENYKDVRPTVSVQVAGGGSGVGLAGLIDATSSPLGNMPELTATSGARWPPIVKPTTWAVAPHLLDYERTRAEFSWSQARAQLDGLPGGRGLNIAHEAVDRHAAGPRRDRVALRWLSKEGARRDFTYADLRDETNRFANVLKSLGVGKGDPVAVLAGRIPELYIAALGTLKNGSVFTPLFSAFGPEPIQSRINGSSPPCC
jgi:hypothetical protein